MAKKVPFSCLDRVSAGTCSAQENTHTKNTTKHLFIIVSSHSGSETVPAKYCFKLDPFFCHRRRNGVFNGVGTA